MALVVAACVAVLVTGLVTVALLEMNATGVYFRQALYFAPLKVIYRIDTHRLRRPRRADGPVIYAICEQSKLDPAIYMALLPDDTLHVLDPASAGSWLVQTFRSLARSVVFDKEHMIANRRLVRHLKGNGRLAVYFPEDVEPDPVRFPALSRRDAAGAQVECPDRSAAPEKRPFPAVFPYARLQGAAPSLSRAERARAARRTHRRADRKSRTQFRHARQCPVRPHGAGAYRHGRICRWACSVPLSRPRRPTDRGGRSSRTPLPAPSPTS